jgi:unsaturated chondroitin disaccharide hydrolase
MSRSDDLVATADRQASPYAAALEFAAGQVRTLIERHPGEWTTFTQGGRWVFAEDPWAPTWSGGFLTGLLWIFAERTGDPWWRARAEEYSRLVEPRKHDASTHDIGFLFEPSWGRWYDLDPTPESAQVLVDAGRTMAGRFQPNGRYLCTWVDPGSTFIDVMMNVGIILRAAEYAGDDSLREIALAHARTSLRYLVRGDGSTVHEGWFDTDTGEFLRAATHQGARPDSTWARGQAWAIYGFTTMYRHTRDAEMLDAARRTADYYIRHTPDHGVPPNDLRETDHASARESSAGAIAAAGMLHLADALAADQAAERYRAYGRRILDTLVTPEYLAVQTPGWEGILRHASYHFRNGLGIDESVMWGDYYFVEALSMLDARTGGSGGAA